MRKKPNLSLEDRAARADRARAMAARRFGHQDDEFYRQKLKAQTRQEPTGCWIFTAFIGHRGYGQVNYRGRKWRAHRLAYHLFNGPIPRGLVICHTCDVRACCNPLHLFLGTFDTNNKDMAAKGRCKYSVEVWPQCKSGHEFTPENTRVCKRGFRHCKQCEKDRFATPEYKVWRTQYQRTRRAKLKAQRLGMSEEV